LTSGCYQAQRSYSIASPPKDHLLALTVERVHGREVSPYLIDEVRPGDQFESRGPIGGYFVWSVDTGGPLNLIAGGSGVTPVISMLRHRARTNGRIPALLLYSSRRLDNIIYRQELEAIGRADPNLRIVHALTRKPPEGWTGHSGRIDDALLAMTCFPSDQKPKIYVCGPMAFVEDISARLIGLGHDPLAVKRRSLPPFGWLSITRRPGSVTNVASRD
jgi:ferredoxin-NADP reductase